VNAATGRFVGRFVLALLAGGVLAWVSGCGSGGSGTVAQQAQQAASTAATQVDAKLTSTATNAADSPTVTATVTEPTRTVTVPGPGSTVTETKTVAAPSHTTTISGPTTTVQVAPTSSNEESNEGVPTWGWFLIGLGVVVLAIVMFMAGRGRRRDDTGAVAGPAGGATAERAPPPE
jgi:hypothetical protein